MAPTMPGPGSAGLFASLRSAARLAQESFLVGVADAGERARVVAALSAEGVVVELPTVEQALDRLSEEPFELAVLDAEGVSGKKGAPSPPARRGARSPVCWLFLCFGIV